MTLMQRVKSRLLTKPHRNPVAAWLASRLYEPRPPRTWGFIIACYGSGTSLLTRLLGTHREISSLSEGAFKTSALLTPEEVGWPRMWLAVERAVGVEPDADQDLALQVKRDWSPFFDAGKVVFLEKSIVNATRMLWLQRNFSDARFIYMVRNPYAVAEGTRRHSVSTRSWPPPERAYSLAMCARQWLRTDELVVEAKESIRNLMQISYEQLCASPAPTLAKIVDFLGVEGPNSDQWATRTAAGANIVNRNDCALSRLTPSDAAEISKVLEGVLPKYGYHEYRGNSNAP